MMGGGGGAITNFCPMITTETGDYSSVAHNNHLTLEWIQVLNLDVSLYNLEY